MPTLISDRVALESLERYELFAHVSERVSRVPFGFCPARDQWEIYDAVLSADDVDTSKMRLAFSCAESEKLLFIIPTATFSVDEVDDRKGRQSVFRIKVLNGSHSGTTLRSQPWDGELVIAAENRFAWMEILSTISR